MRSKRFLFMVVLGTVLFASVEVRGEDNKALVRRWFEEVLNKKDLAAIGNFIAPTYVGHAPGAPDVKGPDGFRQRLTALHAAFPDLTETIEDMIAEGDKVVVRNTLRGTHRGEIMGMAPTGKPVTWTTMGILRIVNGKFEEGWIMSDLGQQLRLLSARGQSKP
ncbi:MAG TPA: ester cyclase [Candidatus Binatia bacterium]|jgi:predicted ester cyclase|nr:ester cyclase [Candidatus Binatia bacterium]